MVNKKSQVALEFIMTYGWAILVVLVAIGALAYFGVLSPDKFLPSRCTLPAGIACTDFRVSSDATNAVQLVLRNGLGYDIDTISVRVGGCTGALTGATAMTNGDEKIFTGSNVLCPNLVGGKKFTAAFGVVYRNADTTLTHAVNGSLTTRVE